MPGITIVDLHAKDADLVRQVAGWLPQAFAHIPYLETFEKALAEVEKSFAPGHISRVALDNDGAVGWIGGIESYDGNVYELHPLAVKPSHWRRGIGTALVRDLEEQARLRGALTVYLGTDDEFGGTTLYGVDVYPNALDRLGQIQNIGYHPFEFYQKCGYAIVGILPDANGFGKPDIFMAKRVSKDSEWNAP